MPTAPAFVRANVALARAGSPRSARVQSLAPFYPHPVEVIETHPVGPRSRSTANRYPNTSSAVINCTPPSVDADRPTTMRKRWSWFGPSNSDIPPIYRRGAPDLRAAVPVCGPSATNRCRNSPMPSAIS